MNVQAVVLVVHAVACLFIIMLVLFQRGKGAEAGAAFGAGASGTVFGAKGSANFLSRSTGALAVVFFATSLALAYIGGQRPVASSILDDAAPESAEISVMDAGEVELGSEPDASLGLDSTSLPDMPAAPDEGELSDQN